MTTPGTASTSDARKRAAEADQHWTHPDPAVRDLIAQAEKRGAVEALRKAAGAAHALEYPASRDPRHWARWLRARADRLDAQDGGEGRG